MIGMPSSIRIYLATEPADMRKGPDGLAQLVRASFDESVFSGHIFAFLSRRRNRAKLLWWDRGGFVVYYKRLERGCFRRPVVDGSGHVQLSAAELQSLLEGIDLSSAPRARLWEPRVAA
jgi:transposase